MVNLGWHLSSDLHWHFGLTFQDSPAAQFYMCLRVAGGFSEHTCNPSSQYFNAGATHSFKQSL